MNKLLQHTPYRSGEALAALRFILGFMMAWHGFEVFNSAKMNDYVKWMNEIHFFLPDLSPYLGKGAEFFAGVFLMIGLFTRLAALVIVATMSGITFGIGQGRILMEDQHPFLFVIIAALYLFLGGGEYSLDKMLFNKSDKVK